MWICVHVCVPSQSVSLAADVCCGCFSKFVTRFPLTLVISSVLRHRYSTTTTKNTYIRIHKHARTLQNMSCVHICGQKHMYCVLRKSSGFYIIIRTIVNAPRTIQKVQHCECDHTTVCTCICMYVCMYRFIWTKQFHHLITYVDRYLRYRSTPFNIYSHIATFPTLAGYVTSVKLIRVMMGSMIDHA